jgi:hypothetical protein
MALCLCLRYFGLFFISTAFVSFLVQSFNERPLLKFDVLKSKSTIVGEFAELLTRSNYVKHYLRQVDRNREEACI